MNIHHATIKRAASLGIVLTADDVEARAFHAASAREVFHDNPKAAIVCCLLAVRFGNEYPGISVRGTQVEDGAETYWVETDDTLIEFEPLADDYDEDEIFAGTLEALQDILPEGAPEDEIEEATGGVVPIKYKNEYRARGNANHCGDWLAGVLDGQFTSEAVVDMETGKTETRFDHVAYAAMLAANGVDMTGKWASLPDSGGKGWQGRYRMNGRQKLEVRVAMQGFLMLDGRKIKADADWLELYRGKHNLDAKGNPIPKAKPVKAAKAPAPAKKGTTKKGKGKKGA